MTNDPKFAGQNSAPIYRGARATTRLHQLGITEPLIAEAVRYMIAEDATYTSHDPRVTRGIARWGRLNRGIRDQFATETLGWEQRNVRGYEITVHPSGAHAIAVQRGSAEVGSDRIPSTRKGLGPMSHRLVARNQGSFGLVAANSDWAEDDDFPEYTWMLLFHIDRVSNEVRLELSLPRGMTSDGRIREWDERIILMTIPYQIAPIDQALDTDQHDDDDLDDDNWVTPIAQ